MKAKRHPLPTEEQSRILRRIAQAGGILMLTHSEDGDRYHDALGITVNEVTARILIRNQWVVAERDSMFDLSPQTWRVKEPAKGGQNAV